MKAKLPRLMVNWTIDQAAKRKLSIKVEEAVQMVGVGTLMGPKVSHTTHCMDYPAINKNVIKTLLTPKVCARRITMSFMVDVNEVGIDQELAKILIWRCGVTPVSIRIQHYNRAKPDGSSSLDLQEEVFEELFSRIGSLVAQFSKCDVLIHIGRIWPDVMGTFLADTIA
jgi:hypothetical protein